MKLPSFQKFDFMHFTLGLLFFTMPNHRQVCYNELTFPRTWEA